jgi:hypothetical protein
MSVSTRLVRLSVALALAIAIGWVPVSRVAACSCALSELPEALASADVAFVGRIGSATEEPGDPMLGARVAYHFEVERSRDAIPAAELSVVAWPDNGANCGITLAVDERWLILAYAVEDVLETNGCNMNRRLDGSDAELEATISELLTVVPDDAPAEDAGLTVPTPVVFGAGALAVVAVVGLFAFRRKETP